MTACFKGLSDGQSKPRNRRNDAFHVVVGIPNLNQAESRNRRNKEFLAATEPQIGNEDKL